MDTNQSIKDTTSYIKDTGNSSLYLQKISLKTERLTSALYLVTDFLDYDEPLKNKLRTSAIEVMSVVSMSNSSGQLLDDRSLAVIRKNISTVISCLEVSFNAGVCSSMNCEILKREYGALRDLLASDFIVGGVGAVSIPSNFLYPSLDEIKNIIPKKSETNFSSLSTESSYRQDKGQIKDSQDSRTSPLVSTTRIGREVYKGDRRGLVVSLFTDGCEYTVKDIISRLSLTGKKVEISEKTIQRDLLSLVSEGVLKKRGERRWSRYSKK
ncbi:MAG: hypothetical protein AAB965_00160 [Patescibacteria group bacterium]